MSKQSVDASKDVSPPQIIPVIPPSIVDQPLPLPSSLSKKRDAPDAPDKEHNIQENSANGNKKKRSLGMQGFSDFEEDALSDLDEDSADEDDEAAATADVNDDTVREKRHLRRFQWKIGTQGSKTIFLKVMLTKYDCSQNTVRPPESGTVPF